MFLNFKISNYRSIGGEITIDFGIRDSQRLGAYSEINNQSINNIACLVGPNAGGKSNVLKGIVYYLQCLIFSYSNSFYRFTNGLKNHFCRKDSPSIFSTEFIDNNIQYKYEIVILNGVVQKELFQKRDENSKRYSYLFDRQIHNEILLGKSIKINKQDINRLGDDMSLLSLMLELNYIDKNDLLLLKDFDTNVTFDKIFMNLLPDWKINNISHSLQNDSLLLDELINELKIIDTGINSLEMKKSKSRFPDPDIERYDIDFLTILTNHKIANNDYPLSIHDESAGTLHYIEIFISIYYILQRGGLFIADELEQSLHPDLTSRIINRFMNKDKNPNNAQLLFTTHNPWFLQDLTKTQIFITEKNEKAETEITRLDEIKGVRNDENYFTKYLAGEYDGRPKIREL